MKQDGRVLTRFEMISGHRASVCDDHCLGCNLCDGGLFHCRLCGQAEGDLAKTCPNFQ